MFTQGLRFFLRNAAWFLELLLRIVLYLSKRARTLKEKIGVKGCVRWEVTGMNRLPKLAGVNYNIVTDEGDAMIADLMANTPARVKVSNANGYIEVGTGFTSESKSALSCTTPTGSPEQMDASYPQAKGSWGQANDNVTQYKSTFEAGDLNASGIDEAALLNNSVAASGDCLAYAQISPAVDVTSSDTLAITWELTFAGS